MPSLQTATKRTVLLACVTPRVKMRLQELRLTGCELESRMRCSFTAGSECVGN